MADFNFRRKDLDDRSEVARRIMGNAPQGLKTSASTRTNGNPNDVTLFSMSQILMGSPALRNEAEILTAIQHKVTAGLTLITDQLGNIPGLSGLVPDYLSDIVSGASPDAKSAEFSIKNSEGNIPEFTGTFPTESEPFIRDVVSIAKSDVDYKEEPTGSNKQKFATNVGSVNGKPWAMTFIRSALKDAEIPQDGLLSDHPQESYDLAESVGRTGDIPRVGAIAMMNFSGGVSTTKGDTSGVRVDHAGLVIAVESETVRTVEGDVSAASSVMQKGVWVKEKVRKKKDIVAYLYPVYPDGESIGFPVPDDEPGKATGGKVDPGPVVRGSAYSWIKNYQGATYDSGGEAPGARALMDYVTEKFPLSDDSFGIYNYRHIGNDPSKPLSVHSEGRALDIKVPETTDGKSTGDRIFMLLASNAPELGIQAIAWYSQWFSAKSPDGRGHSDHFDHLHVELTREAGGALTDESVANILSRPAFTPIAGGGVQE